MLVTLAALVLAAAPAPAPPLKVMAFNVLYLGADDARSVAAIADEAPDVVCLTELTDGFVKTFEARLAADYPYQHFVTTKGTWGVGIASKHPIVSASVTAVPPVKIPAMEARLTMGGRLVSLTCVHLMPPVGKHRKSDGFFTTLEKNAEVRKKQAGWLVDRYAKLPGPLLVVGDFNEDPGGDALAALEKAGLGDACAAKDSGRCGPTFPGPATPWPPVFTIDHVLGRNVCFSKGATVHGGGSDHYPVLAELALGACGGR